MNSISKNLKYDISSGFIVFLVAVPLCLGIALASGAPLFAGIIAGFVGGIVVSMFSGSALGVSGPAAGLVAIVIASIETLGGFETFLLAVVIAGLIQLLLGYVKAGLIAYYFPSSVIKGMLAAIGIIIILKQIPHAFGYDEDYEGDLAFMQPDGQNTISEIFNMWNYIQPGALTIALISIGILILWERPFMKKFRLFQIVQGPLVVVAFGIILNNLFVSSGSSFAITSEHLVNIPLADGFSGFLGLFQTPDLSALANPDVYVVALTIAAVASIETLLCLEATDKLDPSHRVSPANKELKAQGIGNIVSGLIGGLPITQVIVRSSANIQSGGKSRMSAFLHGIFLLVSVMAFPAVLNMIPLASLAAILLSVGYKLAKPSLFRDMRARGYDQFLPFVITILAILFTDLLVGIGIGMAVAIFFLLRNNYKVPYYFNLKEDHHGEIIEIKLAENVSFLNKGSILQTLNHIPEGTRVIVDASRAISLPNDIVEVLEDFRANALTKEIEFEVHGLNGDKARVANQAREFRSKFNPNIRSGIKDIEVHH